MKIMLNASYSARADFSCIGYVGETNARTITFEGLVIEGADSYKMRFEYPDGTSYEVDITNGSYTVGGSLLRCACEVQLYGTTVWSSSAYDVGMDNRKLPVFGFITPVQFGRNGFWLRSVVSGTHFALCNGYGSASSYGASGASYVRPIILFG